MTISAVVTTHNDGERVRPTLESLKWCDELIVIDDYSHDDTVEIAKEYTNRVYQDDNKKNWNLNKNRGFERARYEWILNLDSDEEVTPELRVEIQKELQNVSEDVVGFYIPRLNHFGFHPLRHGGWWPDLQLRLFRRGQGGFPCVRIHERLEVNGGALRLQNYMIHHTYRDVHHYIEKMNAFTDFEVKERLIRTGGELLWLPPTHPGIEFFREWRRQGFTGHSFHLAKKHLTVYRHDMVYWIPFRPFMALIYRFILRAGWRDGWIGFVAASFSSMYRFVADIKYLHVLWERRHSS